MKLCGTVAAALAAAATLLAQAPAPDCKLVSGWQQKGAARSYVADNLYEYMDGNAEGYLIYGFARMNGITCQQGEKELVIDVSEFNDPDAAYGMFTGSRDSRRPVERIGMAGQVLPRRATFVKGSIYVEIAANPDGDYTPVLRAFVTELEKRTTGRTALPEALSWFSAEKLTSIRLVPESVLGLRALKRGYSAEYEYGKAFLVKEASAQAAAAVMEKLKGRFGDVQPASVGEQAFQIADRYLGRLCFFRKGAYLGGFANVAEGQDPLALAGALAAKIP